MQPVAPLHHSQYVAAQLGKQMIENDPVMQPDATRAAGLDNWMIGNCPVR